MTTRMLALFTAISAVGACGGDSGTDAPPSQVATPAAEAQKAPSPKGETADVAVPTVGTPPAPDLPSLAAPGGEQAAGNVPSDVQAALGAKSCTMREGELVDCPAEDAFLSARNNFVEAKAAQHGRTLINLLGTSDPKVRILVLDASPVDYFDVYLEEEASKPETYEPILAAALVEKDPDVRESFADEVARIPVFSDHPRLVPYLGAIGERYGEDEGVGRIISTLKELWYEDCSACLDALLGIASRNPAMAVRIDAISTLHAHETAPATLCPLILANIAPADDDDEVRWVTEMFTGEEPDCSAHYDAWLSKIPAQAKAGTLTAATLTGVMDLNNHHKGAAFVPKIRTLGKELAALVANNEELASAAQEMSTLE